MESIRVILLPGSVLPAQPAYEELIKALGPDVQAVAKDLELYAGDEPPADWSLDTEVDGVLREAEALGWETFHLVGYSGGGAAALAFAAKHPDRLLSLALLEPAWAGNWDWSPAHAALWRQYEQLEALPPEQFLPAFMRLGVKPDVVLPPQKPGPRRRGWPSGPPASRPSCRLSKAMTWTGRVWPPFGRPCSLPWAA